jgi:hypothetical protein
VKLSSLTIDPTTVRSGSTMTGTVTLDGPAPGGSVSVTIESSNGDARPPASVSVGSGNRSATFTINTADVSSDTEVTITASYGGVSKSVQVRIQPGLRPARVTIVGKVG